MNATATVSIANARKVLRYKIIDPENVVLVSVCPKDSRLPHKVSLKALVGVPGMVNLSQCPVIRRGLKPSHSGERTTIEDPWNEVDESELCAGTLDTLLTSPDFVEDCERDKILSFAPGENNHSISIFKDHNCEELAYPGIFCGHARAGNKERFVPAYYNDICKSELRRSDRRVAQCVENIFFKLKDFQIKIILGKCQVVLRKHKTKEKL